MRGGWIGSLGLADQTIKFTKRMGKQDLAV